MQGNLLTTLLALVFYIASGLFGGNSNSNIPVPAGSGTAYTNPASGFPRAGVVSGAQVNLRDNYLSSGAVIDTIKSGAHLLILEEKNGYYRVQTDNGTEGWVAKWTVSSQNYSSGARAAGKVIAGYYVENYRDDPVGYRTLSQNLGIINMVIPVSFKIDQYGTIQSNHNPKPFTLARSGGADTLALINNIQGNNFSSGTIHRMLSSSSSRARAISGILRLLVEKGYQGVNIDFENVPANDRAYLTAFFRELAAALRPRNLLVTASLPAKTYNDTSSSHGGAFDYQALAPYLDQAMIMTYDEHYSGGGAGPVASYPWVEKVIQYALRYFPARKIILGLAAYGYDWGWGSATALNYSAIQSLLRQHQLTPKWDSVSRVPYFKYRSWGIQHQVWYEDRFSTAAKMTLVRKYGLRGVAVWRLGYEDPGIWKTIQQGF